MAEEGDAASSSRVGPPSTFDRWLEAGKKLGAVLLVAALGYVGEHGGDGGFIKDIWVGLKTASPVTAMVMFLLFMDERRERRDAQRQCAERTIDFIKATHAATSTVQSAIVNFNTAVSLAAGQMRARPGRRKPRRAA